MDNIYLIFIILLGVLAVSDLFVGVSNDAVNFLNSAVGSKAAPFKIIVLVASIGVIVGATFSSGMMDIARNGVFHPDKFYFNEVMMIFLAVMITDVILLDFYNTFGLPTSTTVSMVFELLGASVGVVLYKISLSNIASLGDYINTAKVLAIVSGILISVVVSFSVGAFVQYFVRLLFTFNYKKTYQRYGAIFGGLAVSAIVYFMLMKGAKGASFMSEEMKHYLSDNSLKIIIVNFVVWSLIFELFILTTRINIFRIVILAGTFALAMAFAGNDLVNFIGVPLAGLESFKVYHAGITEAHSLSVAFLLQPVKTPTFLLLAAGLIMSLTLFISRKAKTVTQTELNLSKQDPGNERFESSMLARNIVRFSIALGNVVSFIIPAVLRKSVQNRLDKSRKKAMQVPDVKASFDLVRASVNLVISSVLIASATSLKLPLSTTYVTFMVAMGSALADGAWDRESAVYRVTGVITVIGGWFFTALTAFTMAVIVALIISAGGTLAIYALGALVIFMAIRFHFLHKKREQKKEVEEKEEFDEQNLTASGVFDRTRTNSISNILAISKFYFLLVSGLIDEKRKKLKKAKTEIAELNQVLDDKRNNLYKTISRFQDDSVDSAHLFIQASDYIHQAAKDMLSLSHYIYEYIDNNHAPLKHGQVADLNSLSEEITEFINLCVHYIRNSKFDLLHDLEKEQIQLIDNISKIRKKTLKQIKKQDISTKNSLLYLRILSESENIIYYITRMLTTEAEMYNVLKK